jgi:bifunctional UDP-N-acetylglucosamine pyrophosphorylase/glucosamine-1-phosphate N-acetyltransferase
MERGVGVLRGASPDSIRQSYSVEERDGRITRLVEKPRTPPNDLLGMGFYFLDRTVFEYIDRTKPSDLRGEVEITDALDLVAREGPGLGAAFFEGDYVNINTTRDVDAAASLFST